MPIAILAGGWAFAFLLCVFISTKDKAILRRHGNLLNNKTNKNLTLGVRFYLFYFFYKFL